MIKNLTSTLNASGPIDVIGLSDNILLRAMEKCGIYRQWHYGGHFVIFLLLVDDKSFPPLKYYDTA